MAGVHVVDTIPTANVAGPGGQKIDVTELVFAGSLTTLDGIKVFCEAIDIAASQLADAGISISFVGIAGTIDHVPSEEWIDIYAGNWHDYGLDWKIEKV